MTIAFRCPTCQKSYQVKDEYGGRTTKCQGCQTAIRIPVAATEAAAPVSKPASVPPAAATATVPKAAPKVEAPASPKVEAPPAPKAPPKVEVAAAAKAPAPPAPKPPPKVEAPPAPKGAPEEKPAAKPAPGAKPAPPKPEPPAVKPAPVSAPSPAAEKPAGAEPTIKFTCFYCEVEVQFPTSLASKQAPCPECQRIIKVPALAKEQPRDWREAAGPSLANIFRQPEAEPDGAWSSASVGTVSKQSLEEAGVTEAEPVSLGQWVKRGGIAAAVVVVLGLGWWAIASYRQASREEVAIARVRAAVTAAKLPAGREGTGELFRALGEYYLRVEPFSRPLTSLDPAAGSAMTPARAATEHFAGARGALMPVDGATALREVLLIDLARSQILLGGTSDQVRNRRRTGWEVVGRELKGTLDALGPAPIPRSEFLRTVTRDLVARNHAPVAIGLASTTSDDIRREAMATVALELWRSGQGKEAEALANSIAPTEVAPMVPGAVPAPTAAPPPLPAPALVSLWLVLGQAEKAKALQPKKEGPGTIVWLFGYLDGLARSGQGDQARTELSRLRAPVDRLRGLTVLAIASLDKPQPDPADLTALTQALGGEFKDQVADLTSGNPDISWRLWRVARIAAGEASQAKAARTVADAIPDPVLRGLAQFEVFRAALARNEDVKAEDIDANSSAQGLARELLARRGAGRGRAGSLPGEIESWPEPLRPFGYAGLALGLEGDGR
jgi:hypothetical protein